MCVLIAHLCPNLCDPINYNPSGSSMKFSRQEYWSGLPFPSPGDPPDPGIKPGSPALQADGLPSELLGKPIKVSRAESIFKWKSQDSITLNLISDWEKSVKYFGQFLKSTE